MSNIFMVIKGGQPQYYDLLASMHKLRWEVFKNELQWSAGLNTIRKMEYDEYDLPNVDYIVRLTPDGDVDATCRLMPTSGPYMIADHYADFIKDIPLPRSKKIWEISRFCASTSARTESNGRVTGELIAAAIEFGMAHGVQNYIALASDYVLPVVRRLGGWDPKPLGDRKATPDDHAYSVIYSVDKDMLNNVRIKNKISRTLLPLYANENIAPTQSIVA